MARQSQRGGCFLIADGFIGAIDSVLHRPKHRERWQLMDGKESGGVTILGLIDPKNDSEKPTTTSGRDYWEWAKERS